MRRFWPLWAILAAALIFEVRYQRYEAAHTYYVIRRENAPMKIVFSPPDFDRSQYLCYDESAPDDLPNSIAVTMCDDEHGTTIETREAIP